MDLGLMGWLGVGGVFALSATGSIIGIGINGQAVIGAWKKCFVQRKPAPFLLVIFAGVNLSNVIYGFILMNALAGTTVLSEHGLMILGLGAGIAIFALGFTQAMCAAAAAEAFAETGQGFGNFIMVIGIAETLALFTMVFTLMFT
ncbi:MAG: V-type ATP synthase subunit K [Spirochaetes bacterium]|nr:V-type ATP synthase subunit K [Spirochaetota bacterium]